MMDENEKLEKAGQKLTGGENNDADQQLGKSEQPRGMGGWIQVVKILQF